MPTYQDRRRSARLRVFSAFPAAVLFAGLAVFAAVDAVMDVRLGLPSWTIAIDGVLTAAALLAGAAYAWRSFRIRREAAVLVGRLAEARADAERWRTEAAGVFPALGAAIQRQFERWGLTPEEQHVTLQLLNGLSAREIAELRGSHVRAVRQQSFDIYRKTGLSSRTALAAFFLQDLLFLAGRPATGADDVTLGSGRTDEAHWH